MPRSNRKWFPTDPGQSAVVLVLTVLFLCNATVLALMVSGELPIAGAFASSAAPEYAEQGDQPQAVDVAEPIDAQRVSAQQVVPVSLPAVDHVATPPIETPEQAAQPVTPAPRVSSATNPDTPDLIAPAGPVNQASPEQTQPEPNDPPITFFGVEVE